MVTFRSDLLARGVTPAGIRAEIRSGGLRRVRRGAYAVHPRPATPEERHLELIRATVPTLSEGSVLSHVSAGVLHGLWLPPSEMGRVHATRPGRGGGWVSRGVHLHRGEPDEVVPVADLALPMTGLERTTVDLVRMLPVGDAVAVADSALRLGLDREHALALLTRQGRARGNVTARIALEHADAASESRGESWSRWRMHELGLPVPVLQQVFVTEAGEHVARTNFWWPELRLVGEFDGRVKYGRLLGPGQDLTEIILAEKAREEALRRQGQWVVRWTWAELQGPAFEEILGRAMRDAARR